MSSIYFQMAGFAILVLLMFMFFSKEKVNNRETHIYSRLLVVTFFALIFDITIILVTYFNELSKVLPVLWVLNKFYLTTLLLYVVIFSSYIRYISIDHNNKKQIKNYHAINKALIYINIICIFIIFILPIDIYNQDGVMYSYGASINFLVVIVVLYTLSIIYYTLKNYRNILSKKYSPLFSLILLIILTVVVRNLDPGILLTTAVAAYVDLIMYFTIENPDKKLIDALNQAKLSAEKANHAKSDFLSNMSHEIRTPLNAIVGFSDCILEEETLDAAKSDAKDIKLASENLLEIVNGILDISKIEADKMEIVETDYNIVETLDNVAKLVKPRIGDKPIEMFVKFAPDIPYIVHGDGGKLRQIVTNILTNAVKYTESGSVTFNVSCLNDETETRLIISVEDTGRGIKPEQIDKLFTKFQRLDEDKNTTLEGTGLGLAITKRFVEMMGGKIVVQSKYGDGSKFTVYLKQKIVTMNRPATKKEDDLFNTMQVKLFDFSKCHVLVVDDNKVNIKVALKILSNYGVNADSAESGFEALEKIKSGSSYDLILLDDMMPKMSGVETLKRIRENGLYSVPVIALTANALSGMKEKYISEGFNDYLAKPIEKTELYRILLTYLNNKMQKSNDEKKEELRDVIKVDINKKSVLIVDDNKINIKIAAKLLSNYDLEIDTALSGKEAIEKVKNKAYDLVFMDIMMPEMDGVETLHHLRDDLGFKNPVVTLTADAVEGSKEKYLKEGFDDYIAKPINNKIVDGVVQKYLYKD